MEINGSTDPMKLLADWMEEARKLAGVREPTAMTVSTCSEAGLSSRVVLCRGWSSSGIVFFTNYQSRKGREIESDSRVAATFYWDPLARQINISGIVKKTSREASVAYWNARARESQLSQWISHQSRPVSSREELERLWKEADARFGDSPIPCPDHWGGYEIEPERIEFWIGRSGRLHDRYLFEKSSGGWTFVRLYP